MTIEVLKKSLVGVAENVPKVYEAGSKVGFDAGKKAEYDAFWDAFQENGNRRDYRNAFCTWKPEYYKPKYPIIAEGNAATIFWGAKIEEIGVLDCTEATRIDTGFYQCFNLKTIEKLIVSEKCTTYASCFTSCNELENITIEGTIAASINFQYSSKLSKVSIKSIINALSATSGLTVTFSKTAVNNAFGIDIDDESTWTFEWLELRGTKSKWTFNYV